MKCQKCNCCVAQVGAAFVTKANMHTAEAETRVPVGLASLSLSRNSSEAKPLAATAAITGTSSDGSIFSNYSLAAAAGHSRALSISKMHFKPVQRVHTAPADPLLSRKPAMQQTLFAIQWQAEAAAGVTHRPNLQLSSSAIWSRTPQNGLRMLSKGPSSVAQMLQQIQASSQKANFELRTAGAYPDSLLSPARPLGQSAYAAAAVGILRVAAQEGAVTDSSHLDCAFETPSSPLAPAPAGCDAFGMVHGYGTQQTPLLCSVSKPSDAPAGVAQGQGLLITGGLGDIGSLIAAWAANTAAEILLLGRTGRSRTAGFPASVAESAGCLVTATMCDASSKADIAEARGKNRLSSILHAGGIIRDAPLQKQGLKQLREVLAPKLNAFDNLEMRTWAEPLSCDIAFSSLSCLLGTAGQANYAAANLALNAAAASRQTKGTQQPHNNE